MDCKSCKWLKIYEYKFPDGTKTIGCEKHNKHLGFTNKRGQVTKTKHLIECKGDVRKVIDKEGVYFDSTINKYKVIVNDNGRIVDIAEVDSRNEGHQILNMFRLKVSYVPHIYWLKAEKSWLSKVYDKTSKRYIHLIQTKYYSEALKKLKEFKGDI